MARTENLYRRLEQLEGEFTLILASEFQQIAAGQSSRFLSRKVPNLSDGKYWRDAETQRAEKMEREILVLREKLGETPHDGPVAVTREFVRRRAESSGRYDRGQTLLAKELLARLTEAEPGAASGGDKPTK